MIIGIAGPTASGKTTVAHFLEKERSALRVRYSAILFELAREKGIDSEDKEVLQKFFASEREERGESFLAEEVINRVALLHPQFLVIEGNRRLVDIDGLKRIATSRKEKLLMVYIDAPTAVRLERYNHRLKDADKKPVNGKAFAVLESAPAEDELGKVRDIIKKEGIYINTETLSIDDTMKAVYDAVEVKK